MGNSAKTRQRQGRRESHSFSAIPKPVITALQEKEVSSRGYKLLIDLFEQYNGNNNGDLSCAFSDFRLKGWRSKMTLTKAKKELIDEGFIEKTRQGLRSPPICDLFAVTWKAIDDCRGKLDVQATAVPSNHWKKNR